ncbi:uncharacterized protein [Cicer arietinum]|uniref:Uncharacterized protein LOC101505779 isoform X2 n=1 Tax=Cicer arietinum TaxID=3827 RepID=A0A3Q7YF62_CICAR|nr:uncharacterized protein LOC101505779 isoform X2 [Cicer arietinum]
MECNKGEAARAKEIAERKFSEREYAGAKKFAIKALNLYPPLEGLSQLLVTLDVYISAENKINGEMDWYGILGVKPFADEETVRKQYRKLALTLHPDKNKTVGAEGAFKLVLEAWSLLSDKVKRLAYNQNRSSERSRHNAPNHAASRSGAPGSNGFNDLNKNAATSNARTENSNARPPPTSVPPLQKISGTFWTICNQCRTHYEYQRVYLNHTLLCPNCKKAFVAIEKGPPAHAVKSSNGSSRQHHQKVRHHTGRSQPVTGSTCFNKTNIQSGPHSRMPGFGSAGGSSSIADVSVKQHSGVKREFEGVASSATWEKNLTNKGSGGSFSNIENPMKKFRKDDIRMHMMTKGDGAAGFGRVYESGKTNNLGTERVSKHYSTRELSLFELRNMLIDKAKREICKKIQEWRSMAEAKVTNKDKGNKRRKNAIGDKRTGSEKHRGSAINGKSDSIPVASDDTLKENDAISVPDPDFHNFDMDRAENSFEADQVWAAYDEDDGMPRYYARIHKDWQARNN